jgi:diaminopimelate epimerase
LNFTKWHGAGNDFLIGDWHGRFTEVQWQSWIARISERHFGVGADGVMLVAPSPDPEFAARMLYYNSDGSRAAMCGNGIRCFAAHLHRTGRVRVPEFKVLTDDGPKEVRLEVVENGYNVEISMGRATFEADRIPVLTEVGYMLNEPIEVLGRRLFVTALKVGVPHLIIEVDQLDQNEIMTLGPALETHPAFPEKINVNFVRQTSRTQLDIITWERGAGLTLACGTGASAAFYAFHHNGKLEASACINVPGGQLDLRLGEGEEIFMTGPAVPIAEVEPLI